MTDTSKTALPAQVAPMEKLRVQLHNNEAEFACALPPQIPVQKFVRTTITAVQMQPDLLTADRRSLFAATMKAAQDGLLVDGREAALVIFNSRNGKQVQYMPMIGGLLKKLRNSGELASISAHVAYENDEFRYELGDDERIVHRPELGNARGEPVAAYAIAKTKDGAVYREVMSLEEIEQVRAVSKAKNNGPWVTWWAEMARKTVLRRLMKRLPSSADLDAVLANDNEGYELAAKGKGNPLLGTGSLSDRVAAQITVEDVDEEGPHEEEGDRQADDEYADIPPPEREPGDDSATEGGEK